MLRHEEIYKEARRVVRMCGTRNPFRIADELGINVIIRNDFEELKGMYAIIERSRFIFINGNLRERDRKTVCAHEIGHDRFHKDLAKSAALQQFRMYDMRSKPEYEANIFAAELLIDGDDLLSLIYDGYEFNHIARELGVDINLMLIKTDELRNQGYPVRVPYRPHSDFLSGDFS